MAGVDDIEHPVTLGDLCPGSAFRGKQRRDGVEANDLLRTLPHGAAVIHSLHLTVRTTFLCGRLWFRESKPERP